DPVPNLIGRHRPRTLEPPCRARLFKRTNDLGCALSTLPARNAGGNDVKGLVLSAMFASVSAYCEDVLWRRVVAGCGFVFLRDDAVPGDRASHRLLLRPHAHHPRWNSRLLDWARQHRHFVDVIVLAFEAELLSAPQAVNNRQ